MVAKQGQVFRPPILDQAELLLRPAAPKHKNLRPAVGRKLTNDRIGQQLPAPSRVRASLARINSQARVEQKHALLSPMTEIPGRRGSQKHVALHFLEDVAQAGRNGFSTRDRKRQSVRLAVAVIRILSEDNDAGICSGRHFKRSEHGSRIYRRALAHPFVDARDGRASRITQSPVIKEWAPVAVDLINQRIKWLQKPRACRLVFKVRRVHAESSSEESSQSLARIGRAHECLSNEESLHARRAQTVDIVTHQHTAFGDELSAGG